MNITGERNTRPGRTYGTFEIRRVAVIREAPPSPSPSPPRAYRPQRRSRRRGACVICCYLSFILLLVLILTSNGLIFVFFSFSCLGPFGAPISGPKNWTDFSPQPYAVGIDLTAGYGTSAVAFDDGDIINVARAEGTPGYNEVLAKLSLGSSAHSTPPYYGCPKERADWSRQWRRYIRKKFGHPASSDVAALTAVLRDLKTQTDAFLAPRGLRPLQIAFITVPYLPALYLQDLVDAGEHAGIQVLTLPWYHFMSGDAAQWPVSEINTAFAGNGLPLGLPSLENHTLTNSTSSSLCSNSSIPEPWSDNLFSVLFTKHALTAHVGPKTSALGFYAASGIANFTLGLSSHLSGPSPHDHSDDPGYDSYWHDIRVALRIALDSYYRGHELGRVISYGESAENEVFDRVLREEVLAAQDSDDPDKRPLFERTEPVFAAARGAVEFARFCKGLKDGCFPDLRPRMQGW